MPEFRHFGKDSGMSYLVGVDEECNMIVVDAMNNFLVLQRIIDVDFEQSFYDKLAVPVIASLTWFFSSNAQPTALDNGAAVLGVIHSLHRASEVNIFTKIPHLPLQVLDSRFPSYSLPSPSITPVLTHWKRQSQKVLNVGYLIEPGSAVSIVLPEKSQPTQKGSFDLLAANNTAIATYGTLNRNAWLSRKVLVNWDFVVADAKEPIIGLDCLRSYKLNANAHSARLYNRKRRSSIPLKEEDIPKTAVITPFGLFEYTVMPFGLRNSGQTFQRYMDHITKEMDFLTCYVDDILIASTSEQEHKKHIHPQSSGEKARTHKPHEKIHKKIKEIIEWTTENTAEFEKLKQEISQLRLVHPAPNGNTVFTTDASTGAVGAVLQQEIDEDLSPVAFFSKKLDDTQRRYSTYDGELLAIVLAVKHFEHFLEERKFRIKIDHKRLTAALQKTSECSSARVARQLSYFSQFDCAVQHISGADNPMADALS
ncbi:Reverse transcriptase domain [Trinorchestia longiramus]|nr:Reverse transcriptase domain [Trinorchestia longiramus]